MPSLSPLLSPIRSLLRRLGQRAARRGGRLPALPAEPPAPTVAAPLADGGHGDLVKRATYLTARAAYLTARSAYVSAVASALGAVTHFGWFGLVAVLLAAQLSGCPNVPSVDLSGLLDLVEMAKP